MSSSVPAHPELSGNQTSQTRRLAGCCAGQALGCGVSFLAGWLGAVLISALILPLLSSSTGISPLVNTLLTGLTCGSSMLIGAVLSFLAGRLFPVLQKKAGSS